MKIKVISWNVRGVNAPEKRKVIKNFLRNYRADIICLQEDVGRVGVWSGGGSQMELENA